jgi:integrase
LLLLEGSGIGLLQAAQVALRVRDARGSARLAPRAWEAALRVFLADVHARGRRDGTMDFYEKKLAPFGSCALVGRWQSISRGELERWLGSLELSVASRGMVFRALRAFYRFAERQDPPWCVVPSPVLGLRQPVSAEAEEIQFYRPEVVEAWLGKVGVALRPALVVQLFAGIRPEEVCPIYMDKERLAWEHFDFAARIVRVPAAVSKTRRARVIEGLPPALWAWLALVPREKRVGPLHDGQSDHLRRRLKAGLPAGVPWISRGPRKSFATHAVAFTGEVGKVALWLGHEGNPTMLHRHYRGLVTKADGAKFFGMRPG